MQSANKFRVEANAQSFVADVARVLKSRFANVKTNRPVKEQGAATDIDVVVLEENTLYLIECKHSVPPTGPHEMRDIWEEIEKGILQLQTAIRILADPVRRQAYLAGWSPGTTPQHSAKLKIVGCVLCSHRVFSGLHHGGFAIRDFSSLARLCDDGIVGMGGEVAKDEVVLRQYRVIQGEKLTGLDLAEYCSPDSKYFNSFKPFMHSVSRLERLPGATIARDTFVYEVELDEWCRHMESLGCVRQPDRRQGLKDQRETLKEGLAGGAEGSIET